MNVRTLTLPAVALTLALGLAACGSTPGKPDANPKPAATVDQPATPLATPDAKPAETKPAGPAILAWGDTFTYADGLSYSVSQPTGYAPSEYAMTEGATAYVQFTITVTNGTAAAYDPFAFQVNGTSGGAAMSQVFDSANGMESSPSAAILPGQSVSWPVAFGVTNPADLTLDTTAGFTADYTSYDHAFYQGAAA